MTKSEQIAVAHARRQLSQAASLLDDAVRTLENAGPAELAMPVAHVRNAAYEAGRTLSAANEIKK